MPGTFVRKQSGEISCVAAGDCFSCYARLGPEDARTFMAVCKLLARRFKTNSEKADPKLTASRAAKSARVENFSTRREAPTARRTSPDTAGKAEIRVPTKAPAGTHPVKSDVFSSKVLIISGDSASLHATNFWKSNVLTVLSKGTIVEPDFELLDADDNWTLVRVPTLNIVGFVQTRNLATPSQETIPR